MSESCALIPSDILQLISADALWRAEVNPVASALVSLWFEDIEIVTSPYHQPGYAQAGVIMAPWPNRLEDGRWQMGAREFVASINDVEGNNANHGLVLGRTFDVIERTECNLRLETNLFDAAAYPFDVILTVNYRLQSTGLEITISTKNCGDASAPIAFGLHPYFVAEQTSHLELNARTWVQKNERNLPTNAEPIEESAAAKVGLNLIEQLQVDDCFTDLIDEDGFSVTRLSRPAEGYIVEVRQTEELSYLMLYTLQEETNQKRLLIAIEPQTAPVNAFKNLDQVKLLAAGELYVATCKINLRKSQ